MTTVYDCGDAEQRAEGSRLAREALRRGELVVIPTDTVYGLAADAFNPAAVQRLQDAKRRGRQTPPAVLVPDTVTINRLAMRVPGAVHQLTPRFWPGGLTIVLQAQAGLEWDLGDTAGAVAVRMPHDEFVLELLREVGPLAVSSANVAGVPAATTAEAALASFGDGVAVYLGRGSAETDADADAGEEAPPVLPSTILDATSAAASGTYRVLRRGAVSVKQLRIVLGDRAVVDLDEPGAAGPETSSDGAETPEPAPEPAPDAAPEPVPAAATEPTAAEAPDQVRLAD